MTTDDEARLQKYQAELTVLQTQFVELCEKVDHLWHNGMALLLADKPGYENCDPGDAGLGWLCEMDLRERMENSFEDEIKKLTSGN